ncbi:MAG: hypothetical protein COB29_16060 [Sulfitobacter sp.]|nr:MAG: hypothetical protein COB29_16060 [Sulfitobacter sp.]
MRSFVIDSLTRSRLTLVIVDSKELNSNEFVKQDAHASVNIWHLHRERSTCWYLIAEILARTHLVGSPRHSRFTATRCAQIPVITVIVGSKDTVIVVMVMMMMVMVMVLMGRMTVSMTMGVPNMPDTTTVTGVPMTSTSATSASILAGVTSVTSVVTVSVITRVTVTSVPSVSMVVIVTRIHVFVEVINIDALVIISEIGDFYGPKLIILH